MLISDTIDVEKAEERWRRVIGIFIRINGKKYAETYNMSMTITLNVSLFLVKYLKMKPTMAEKYAYYEIIQEGDILDLVKLRTKEQYNAEKDIDIAPQTYVHNSHGGFRVDFVNTYI